MKNFHELNKKMNCSDCDTPKFYRMKFTLVDSLVSLSSFYDLGRIPITIGWGNGRVAWIGQKGSKWLNFHTWGGFRCKVFDRDNGVCQKCGKVIAKLTKQGYWDCSPQFVCDHIVPLFKGGKDWHEDPEMANFQTLCIECNKIKTRSDVAKPHIIKQKLGLKVMQYAGFVFEQPDQKYTLEKWLS
jgi:hypothetical protein